MTDAIQKAIEALEFYSGGNHIQETRAVPKGGKRWAQFDHFKSYDGYYVETGETAEEALKSLEALRNLTPQEPGSGERQAALDALDHLDACLDGCYAAHEIGVIRAVLSEKAPDAGREVALNDIKGVMNELKMLAHTSAGDPTLHDDMKFYAMSAGTLEKALAALKAVSEGENE